MVKKREALKLKLIETSKMIFEQKIAINK